MGRTLVLVNLASIMERADEALLPAVYQEVGAALHTTPTGLGTLTLCRSIVQGACYPLAAYASARYNRAHVIAVGAFLWAAATFLVAISETFLQIAISRGLNGIGLALVIPAVQSLVADSTDDEHRGMAFGWLQLTSSIGSILGGICALLLAPHTIFGIAGWRFAFHLVAAISVLVGILVWFFAVDPNFRTTVQAAPALDESEKRSAWEEAKKQLREARAVVKIPTFQILVAQAVAGSFPWSAMTFTAMWLELAGFTHADTAVVMAGFAAALPLGGIFGGKIGDALAHRYPNAGRIVISQIGAGLAVPLAAILIFGLPNDRSTAIAHALVLSVMGAILSFSPAATNGPIFAEIVPVKARTSIYALSMSFTSILSSFAPPAVGFLSQHLYGFKPTDGGGSSGAEGDRENAVSLGKALYTIIAVPMTICTLVYSFLYRTYPRDKESARMQARVGSELMEEGDALPCDQPETGDDGGRTAKLLAIKQ
uniref:Uncharacterized protein n=1 Tax=Avena sativa TaxID=4498 RepID=A0ACD5YIH9_AVESA